MKQIVKKVFSVIIILNLIFLPKLVFATRMPGIGDYTVLISVTGLIAGFVFSFLVVLIHYLTAKKKLNKKRYLRLSLIIFLGTPVFFLLLFFIILLIFSF